MRELTQSTAANVLVFMTDSTDHVTGKASLTLTITASKDGAAFASITPTVTDRGNGWYNLALTTAHTDTLGDLALHVTGTGADPSDLVSRVIAMNKADAVRAGLSALPNAAAGANTGLPVVGTQVPNASANATGGLVVIGTGANKFKSDASSNVTVGGYATNQDPGTIVRDMPDSGAATIGSLGFDIKWGFFAANSVDQRLPAAPAAVGDIPSATTIAATVWASLTSGMSTVGSIGKKLKDWVLGTDNKVLLSTDAQTGVTIPTVTTVTNNPGPTTANIATAVRDVDNTTPAPGSLGAIANVAAGNAGEAAELGATLQITIGTPAGASISADVAAVKGDTASLLARVGAFTGTGVNTVLGFFRAMMRKTAALTPTDVGGTFDNTTDSQEAVRDRGDAAWTTGAGGGGGGTTVNENETIVSEETVIS